MNLFRTMAIGLLLCGAALASAADIPARIEVSYDVLKGDIKVAAISETFTRRQDRYRIESISKAVGLLALFKPETIRVISEGKLNAQGLRPTTYTSQRQLDSERNASADFDWAMNRITLTDRNGKRTLPLPVGTQDRLSAMYQFMFMPMKNILTYDFHMTNGGKLDIYNYLITPGQDVTVPLGTFKAIHVASSPKAGESRTEIWLAAEHANFPCKMTITDPDGGKLTQVLTRFDPTP
ncbi:MAG: DUF3108 domain-containing protein [Nitrosomonadales bacterium]|nr:DUF3108 domain-containing protein [Nitrosomonadales bacterium]